MSAMSAITGIMTIICVIVGVIVATVCYFVILARAFRKSVLWGLASLFVPFAQFVFVILNWSIAGNLFLIAVGSIALSCGVIAANPTFSGFINTAQMGNSQQANFGMMGGSPGSGNLMQMNQLGARRHRMRGMSGMTGMNGMNGMTGMNGRNGRRKLDLFGGNQSESQDSSEQEQSEQNGDQENSEGNGEQQNSENSGE
jgi:hypothetical protein